jgi:hypothetical protein
MNASHTVLRTGRTVSELLVATEATPALLEAVEAAPDPPALLTSLLEAEAFPDAVAFLAHALPRREAVWWAWLCAREAAGDSPAPEVTAILEATHAWIAEPHDARGRAAFERAEAAGVGTPWGLAALAVFFSGSSVAPETVQPVPPGPYDAAKAVAGAVALAAAEARPDDAAGALRDFVEKGMAVADRTNLWTPEPPAGRGRP